MKRIERNCRLGKTLRIMEKLLPKNGSETHKKFTVTNSKIVANNGKILIEVSGIDNLGDGLHELAKTKTDLCLIPCEGNKLEGYERIFLDPKENHVEFMTTNRFLCGSSADGKTILSSFICSIVLKINEKKSIPDFINFEYLELAHKIISIYAADKIDLRFSNKNHSPIQIQFVSGDVRVRILIMTILSNL